MYYPAIRVRILQSEVMGSFKLCKLCMAELGGQI